MKDMKSIVTFHIGEYGKIIVTLSKIMDSRGITRDRLANLTGAKYVVVDRYYYF